MVVAGHVNVAVAGNLDHVVGEAGMGVAMRGSTVVGLLIGVHWKDHLCWNERYGRLLRCWAFVAAELAWLALTHCLSEMVYVAFEEVAFAAEGAETAFGQAVDSGGRQIGGAIGRKKLNQ
jgi:hypothetical protein